MTNYKLFIDGEYRDALSGQSADSINPFNREVYASVQQAGVEDANAAIESCYTAFQSWKGLLPCAREALFIKAAEVMTTRGEELRDVLIDEGGSTMLKAGYEVHHAPSFLLGMAGECRRVMGETYVSDYPGVRSYSVRRPMGVVTAIAPFNFPLLLAVRKIGWAIAAGNCVVLKPSEATPVIGLKLGEIFAEAGFPAGVLNVLPAQGADLGEILITHPKVKKITFTGSTQVGTSIGAIAAANNKKFTLEMGGKNPIVVLDDADVEYAVNAAAFSNFMNQGQVCMTGSRVIVEAGVYDEFTEKFAAKVTSLKHGNPRDPGVVVGPLIRDSQPAFIKQQVDSAVEAGARLLCGGGFEGNVFHPTAVADVTQDMSIFRTECFGPVASVIKAKNSDHALELANDSEYGLTAAVLTNDLQKMLQFTEGLEAGMVHVNGPSIRDEAVVPFGGQKNSGMGREGGRFAMEAFTDLKWVTIQSGQQQFPF
jgi:aldehyde dehydrogenase (NAD+)